MEFLKTLLYLIGEIVFGFLALYFQRSAVAKSTIANTAELLSTVKTQALDYITVAEQKYADLTKAGNTKFEYVVDRIFSQVPDGFKPIITEAMISEIVQSTFDEMERFAMEQLDKKLAK